MWSRVDSTKNIKVKTEILDSYKSVCNKRNKKLGTFSINEVSNHSYMNKNFEKLREVLTETHHINYSDQYFLEPDFWMGLLLRSDKSLQEKDQKNLKLSRTEGKRLKKLSKTQPSYH